MSSYQNFFKGFTEGYSKINEGGDERSSERYLWQESETTSGKVDLERSLRSDSTTASSASSAVGPGI